MPQSDSAAHQLIASAAELLVTATETPGAERAIRALALLGRAQRVELATVQEAVALALMVRALHLLDSADAGASASAALLQSAIESADLGAFADPRAA